MAFRDAPSPLTADLDAMGPKDLSGGSGPLHSDSDLSLGSGYGFEAGGAGGNGSGSGRLRGVLDAASAGAGDVSEGRKGDVLGLLLVATGVFILVLGTWLIVFLNNPSKLGYFAGHPPLQVLATACFTYAILQLQPTSQPRTKVRGLARHQLVILGLGVPSLAVGTGLIFANKVIHESSHFTTWHAVFGLLACVWLVVQVLLGGLSVWGGGAAFGGGAKAKKVWRYHRASGYALLPMFLMTVAIGGNYSSWTASVVGVGVRVLVFTIAPIMVVVGLVVRVRTSKMNFRQ